MTDKVLITGGAGFIGTYVAKALLAEGHIVRVLDSLIEQVHPAHAKRNPILDHVEFFHGDIRDANLVARACEGVNKIVHLAAEVGVGQSMYEIDRYVSVNDHGTAVLLQTLLRHRIERMVVASSMSVYGEGRYQSENGTIVDDAIRKSGDPDWNPCGSDGGILFPIATPEAKTPSLASVYAISKFVQEQLTLNVLPAYGMQAVGLRLFNVYGAGQALSNPYTGVLAIFASRLLNGQRPMVFEDGAQRRDFVHVEDVARAFVLALAEPSANGKVLNIGSGQSVSVAEVATRFASAMNMPRLTPEITLKARTGDIRNCFADITYAREILGFHPLRSFDDSFDEIANWVSRQSARDRVFEARKELEARGLIA